MMECNSSNQSIPNDQREVVAWHLSQSTIFRDYKAAYEQATKLPLTLTPPDGKEPEGELPFETVIPVKAGDIVVAWLRTGRQRNGWRQVPPKATRTNSVLKSDRTGRKPSAKQGGRTVDYVAVTKLLDIFARHLALLYNQIVLQPKGEEPHQVAQAREVIADRYRDNLRLSDVARAVDTNVFSFCRVFRRTTGFTFRTYLARLRFESSKKLLLNPNVRVKEVAYRSGFQTVGNFNQTFRKFAGQSPTAYRRTGDTVDKTVIGPKVARRGSGHTERKIHHSRSQ